jgi:hypothetical protein
VIAGVREWPAYLQYLNDTHGLLQRWQPESAVKRRPAPRSDADDDDDEPAPKRRPAPRRDINDDDDEALQVQHDDRPRKATDARAVETRRALDYVRKHKGTAFAWAVLGLVQDAAPDNQPLYRELAECWRLFEDQPALAYAARYEHARSLFKGGQLEAARKQFRALYDEAFASGTLPPIDADFRSALFSDEAGASWWEKRLQAAAHALVEQRHRPAALALAWQCWYLDDAALANQLVAIALAGGDKKPATASLTLAAITFYLETSQLAQADELLRRLLADPQQARRPELWRLAGSLAQERSQHGRRLACLERALDLEFAHPPEVIDLEEIRQEYGSLLDQYQRLATALATLETPLPPGFVAKVVRAADRWRALDSDTVHACQKTAQILRMLGERELGWDYLTTPMALEQSEPELWITLARSFRRTGELDMAERAFQAGCDAEPGNADYLWERAQCLQRQGKTASARALYRRIAEGQWAPEFREARMRARALLGASH